MATPIELAFDSTVAANTTDMQLSSIVPNGSQVILREFSGSCTNGNWCGLQWGNGSSWTTVRGSHGVFYFDFRNMTFTGDGVNRFRLLRANLDVINVQRIFVHLSAVIRNGE